MQQAVSIKADFDSIRVNINPDDRGPKELPLDGVRKWPAPIRWPRFEVSASSVA
jgi:hypothetical protein